MASKNLPTPISEGDPGHLAHTSDVHEVVNWFEADQGPTTGQWLRYDGTLYAPVHPAPVTLLTTATTRVPSLSYNGLLIKCNALSGTFTFDLPTSSAFTEGFSFALNQFNDAAVLVNGPSGGNLYSVVATTGSRSLSGVHALAVVTKIDQSSNSWLITGNLAPTA